MRITTLIKTLDLRPLLAAVTAVCAPASLHAETWGNRTLSWSPKDGSAVFNEEDPGMIVLAEHVDALGYPRMTVTGAPGSSLADVATLHGRDGRGHAVREWLPVPASGGFWRYPSTTDVTGAASAFYGDSRPYSTADYEPGAMGRPTSMQGPGSAWGTRAKTTAYSANKAGTSSSTGSADELACLMIKMSASGTLSVPSCFPEGRLRVTRVEDEDGRAALTFTDNAGRVALERKVLASGTFLDTYSVYDHRGDLRYVFPPNTIVSRGMPHALLRQEASDKGWIFDYDVNHRPVAVKAPGIAEVYTVYDAWGRVIMTQDGVQRSSDRWTVTKYDRRGRPALEGLVTLAGATRESLQALYADSLLVESRYTQPRYGWLGYTNACGPSGLTPYRAWYYDDYDFYPNPNPESYLLGARDLSLALPGQGMCTGWAVKWDDTYVVGAAMYDHSGRPLAQAEIGYPDCDWQVVERIAYDFRGNPTTKWLTLIDPAIIADTVKKATYTYAYDDLDRLTSLRIKVEGQGERTILANAYDPVGRLAFSRMGALTVDRGYDIRGNLASVSSPAFSQTAHYGPNPVDPSKPCYGGFVAATVDSLAAEGRSHSTAYAYDNAGRLLSALETGDLSAALNETFAYDNASNVTALARSYGSEDVQRALVTYSRNRPVAVVDSSTAALSGVIPRFPANEEGYSGFSHDDNGRLTADPTRGITSITYRDWGNLVKRVTFGSGSTIDYDYRPDGALASRKYTARIGSTIVPFDPADPGISAMSETLVERPALTYTRSRVYRGPWELTPEGRLILHTPAGVYDVDSGRHYWHLADRLGHVRAVVGEDGAAVQATRYFASGVPVDVAVAASGATANDRRAEALPWIADEGLYWLDNAARQRDPLLCRFITPDPLAAKYPSLSPYSMLAANPVNCIDNEGRDVCVLNKGQETIGHMGLLVQNEQGKWSYYSINGINMNIPLTNTFVGGRRKNEYNVGSWDSPEDFLSSDFNRTGDKEDYTVDYYEYQEGLILDTTPEQDKIISDTFTNIGETTEYNPMNNNCATTVAKSLEAAGVNVPHPSLKITDALPSSPFKTALSIIKPNLKIDFSIQPKTQFNALRERYGDAQYITKP